jgi:hypothetical protein
VKTATVISAVLCEDIRQEISGKFSLAGVFGSGVYVPSLPATLVVGIFAEVSFSEPGSFDTDFRVVDPANKVGIKGKMRIVITNKDSAPLGMGPFLLSITKSGDVKVQWKFGGEPWQTIKSFKVQVNPAAPTNISVATALAPLS